MNSVRLRFIFSWLNSIETDEESYQHRFECHRNGHGRKSLHIACRQLFGLFLRIIWIARTKNFVNIFDKVHGSISPNYPIFVFKWKLGNSPFRLRDRQLLSAKLFWIDFPIITINKFRDLNEIHEQYFVVSIGFICSFWTFCDRQNKRYRMAYSSFFFQTISKKRVFFFLVNLSHKFQWFCTFLLFHFDSVGKMQKLCDLLGI